MNINKSFLYESPDAFFQMNGSVNMRLSPDAALLVCAQAARQGLVIARVEGGIWHAPGFESRLDCIWDGQDPPLDEDQASRNNKDAARFIASQASAHSAFILTAPPLTGWPHRAKKQQPG
ncbi:colicin immunity protein [Massilia violaceinigra]|uniref:Colicin immunity protein n=1 Tax=Massilia violaceinigra TaxID=2045208 RepID=A0A2D2DJT6_9BURK|nr:colicin immunity protein [Massilia violaceinigra]ATQ75246.1 colicin immunity protein [Massilia violaceinigra]